MLDNLTWRNLFLFIMVADGMESIHASQFRHTMEGSKGFGKKDSLTGVSIISRFVMFLERYEMRLLMLSKPSVDFCWPFERFRDEASHPLFMNS
jgi:hypothetical protein